MAPHGRLVASFSKFICSIQVIDIINQDLQIEYFNEPYLTPLLSITDHFKYLIQFQELGHLSLMTWLQLGNNGLISTRATSYKVCYHIYILAVRPTQPPIQCVLVVPEKSGQDRLPTTVLHSATSSQCDDY